MNINQSALLEFWFGADLESAAAHAELSRRWFGKNPAFDEQIRSLFGIFPDAAKNGDYDSWRDTDLGMLALVVGLDQFPRNLFRNTPPIIRLRSQSAHFSARSNRSRRFSASSSIAISILIYASRAY